MPKRSMAQRISYHEGKKSAGGTKGAYSKGYLAGVKAQQTASRLARARAAKMAESENGG